MTPADLHNAAAWLLSGDEGASSLTLFSAAFCREAVTSAKRYSYPRDAWDFGRCTRLLDAAPGVREAAFPVLAECPGWDRLIPHWDELTRLWNLNHQWNPVSQKIDELLGK